MQEWIERVLQAPELGIVALPAALLLGALAAVSSGCNLAILTAVAGYGASREDLERRLILLTCVFFMLGTVVSLAALGALAGYLGQAAAGIGNYGQLFAGFITIFFGLAALKLLPFRLPELTVLKGRRPAGMIGAAFFGLAIGASSTTCTMACCAPVLPVVLGLVALRGQAGWGATILVVFAVGYSVPMVLAMLGASVGRLAGAALKAAKPIRTVAGLVLIAAGFWLLATIG